MSLRPSLMRYLTLAAVVPALGFGIWHAAQLPQPASGFGLPAVTTATQQQAPAAPVRKGKRSSRRTEPEQGRLVSHLASSRMQVQVHAASLIELKDGRLRGFWFSGSREGAADVTINSAIYDPRSGVWGGEAVIVTRSETQRALHRFVSKLGNPVPARAADGSLYLFYVTVSLGGWAGSSITMITSSDEGETWSVPRRLITSPFINISTLVKGAPFLYADGSMGVPVYHEFIGKYAELLHLDRMGQVLGKQRLTSAGQGTLQPVVLPQNEQEAQVLMRYVGRERPPMLQVAATNDGGRSWSDPAPSTVYNPNSAVAGVALPGGEMLAVMNNQESGRDSLSLMLSENGGTDWRELHRLEEMSMVRGKPMEEMHCEQLVQGLLRSSEVRLVRAKTAELAPYVASARNKIVQENGCHFEFSYPYMIRALNGDVHLLYTWNRVFIKHVTFDRRWLDIHMNRRADAN